MINRMDIFSEKMIDKFIENPYKYCKKLSSFFLKLINYEYIKKIEINYPSNFKKYKKIINYKKNGYEYSKLVIDDTQFTDIHINPSIEKFLMVQNSKEEKNIYNNSDVFNQIEIINTDENILLFIFHKSMEFLSELDNNDVFYSYKIDINSQDPFSALSHSLKYQKENNEKILKYNIPYFLKRKYLSKDIFTEIALIISAKMTLPYKDEKLDKSYIIDRLGISYLYLTGLYKAFKNINIKLYISERCKESILFDIDNFLSGDYKSLSFSNKIEFMDSSRSSEEEIDNIRKLKEFILQDLIELKEKIHNQNIRILSLHDFITSDTYDSLTLSYIYKIPYLSFDNSLELLLDDIDFKTYSSPLYLINLLKKYSKIKDILNGISLFVCEKIDFPLGKDDINYVLYGMRNQETNHILRNLFNKNSSFINLDSTIKYNICLDLILNTIHQNNFKLFYIEKDFNLILELASTVNKNICSEDNILYLFELLYHKYYFDVDFIMLIYNGIINYSSGRFMNINYINNKILEIIKNNQ